MRTIGRGEAENTGEWRAVAGPAGREGKRFALQLACRIRCLWLDRCALGHGRRAGLPVHGDSAEEHHPARAGVARGLQERGGAPDVGSPVLVQVQRGGALDVQQRREMKDRSSILDSAGSNAWVGNIAGKDLRPMC